MYFNIHQLMLAPVIDDLMPITLLDLEKDAELQNMNVWIGEKGKIRILF